MTLVGKIFSMMIFIMTIVIMVIAISVYTTHTNWQVEAENHKKDCEDQQAINKALQDTIENLKTTVAQEKAARAFRLAALETAKQLAVADRDKLQGDLVKKSGNLREVVALMGITHTALVDLGDSMTKVNGDIVKTAASRDSIAKDVVLRGAIIDSLEGTVRNLTVRNKALAAQVASLTNTLKENGIRPGSTDAPGLAPKGKITATKGNLVEVSIGGDDGLKVGHECNIFRGSNFIGRIRISKVSPDRSVGTVDPKITKGIPKIGDSIETRTR